jgi:hypothetical protein
MTQLYDKKKTILLLSSVCQYYPEIDTCLCEKDGDLLEKQKELKLVQEDFGRSRLGVIR